MMKLFPAPLRTSTFAVRMHGTSLIKQEGTLSFQHSLRRIKAVIHLQAKLSCLWGCTMCRAALPVWGHFSSLGFVMVCWVGLFSVSVLGAGGVPGARSSPCSGQWAGQQCQAHEPKPAAMAVTSWPMARDIRAGIQHLASWGAP